MLISEMLDLKNGDQVRYTGQPCGSWPEHGTVITRAKEWHDEHSVKFTWVDKDGDEDYHFFKAEELEFIKE